MFGVQDESNACTNSMKVKLTAAEMGLRNEIAISNIGSVDLAVGSLSYPTTLVAI